MARVTATHELTIRGETRPAKEALKAAGWKWEPARQLWSMMLVDAHAARIVAGDAEFRRGLKADRKGCQVHLDGEVVWTSKTFGTPPPAAPATDAGPDQDGFGWNTDGHGNAVRSRQIPGSAPNDRI